MKKNIFSLFLIIVLQFSFVATNAQSIAIPDGYAAYTGTTGGGNTTPEVVFTSAQFRAAVSGSTPKVVIVNGRLDMGGDVSIGSNKTVVGANASSGLYGGGVKIQGSNYIIQNLIIGPHIDNDAMEVSGATNVFIHKCDIYDGGDGCLDIVRASDFVTVSWCKFYYVDQDNHRLTMLIGNGDDVTTDEGKLHVTLHHNWFGDRCMSRMPRVRYGHVHIYNNYYSCVDNNYCIGTGYKSHVRVENSYFDGIKDPWDTDNIDNDAILGWDNLKFVDVSQPTYIQNSYPAFDVPYTFEPDAVDIVKSIVTTGAGNVFGGVNNDSLKVEITLPADSTNFLANASITIDASAISENSNVANVSFYCESLLNTDTEAPYNYTWENVETGKYYIWATATDQKGSIAISKGITVFVGSKVMINSPSKNETFNIPANVHFEVEAWDAGGSISKVELYEGENLLGSNEQVPYHFEWKDVVAGTYHLFAKATDNEGNILTSEQLTIIVYGGPEGYEFASAENDEVVSDKLVNIAFGAEGKFNYLYNVTGTTDCSIAVFGDPNPDVTKACYVQEAPTPYVAIVYPAEGKVFQAPAKITLYAKAVDNDGTIDSIEFYQNNIFLSKVKVSSTAVTTYSWTNVPAGEYSFSAKVTDDEDNSFTSEAINVSVEGGNAVYDIIDETIALYPNPVSGELRLNISGLSALETDFTLYDEQGKIVMNKKLSSSEQILDLTSLPNGLYFITLISGEIKINRKIIKN